jgi:hypothetical protein
VLAGGAEDEELEALEEVVVVIDEFEVGGDRDTDGWIEEGLGDPVAVLPVGEDLLELGEVILARGDLDVGEELGALAHEVHTAPEEIAGGPHPSGIDVRLRDHPAAQKGGDLEGVDLVVLRLPAVDSLHVEGVAEDEGDVLATAEVGEPVPGEDALDGDDEAFTVRAHDLEEVFGRGGDVLVDEDPPLAVEDADEHRSGVKVDAAVEGVALGVKSHRGLLLSGWLPPPSIRIVLDASRMLRRRPR